MRILTRYILAEILTHTLIGCALFTFILFMPYLPNVLEMVVRNSSTFSNAMEIFLFTLPNLLRVTIPMAVLVGILLGLSRLAADSEIIAMRASGLGIGYFVWVSSMVAAGGTLLGLANSLYLAPRANQAILDMEQALETSQASYQIQPRVFYEDFKNFVLYVQDVRSGTGAANWRQVFMADVTDPEAPRITTAASATVVNDSTQVLLMRLRNGAEHSTVPDEPDQYNISAFATTDRPLELSGQSDVHLGRLDTAIYALPMSELLERVYGPGENSDRKRFLIELNNRFAFPAACLVLMLVGVPLGVASQARRQEFRLCLHHSAGVSLLLSFLDGHRARPAEQAARVFRGLVGQPAVCRGGHLSAVADGQRRPRARRDHRLGLALRPGSRARRGRPTAFRSQACSIDCSRAHSEPSTATPSRAFWMSTLSASSSIPFFWCWRALCC